MQFFFFKFILGNLKLLFIGGTRKSSAHSQYLSRALSALCLHCLFFLRIVSVHSRHLSCFAFRRLPVLLHPLIIFFARKKLFVYPTSPYLCTCPASPYFDGKCFSFSFLAFLFLEENVIRKSNSHQETTNIIFLS